MIHPLTPPAVNDADSDGAIDSSVAAATAAVVCAAEAAEQDLIDADLRTRAASIIPADKAELMRKAAVDTAKGWLKLWLMFYQTLNQQRCSERFRLDAFTALTPPAVNDADSDGTIDSSVAAATAAVVAAEAAEQDTYRCDCRQGGIINPA